MHVFMCIQYVPLWLAFGLIADCLSHRPRERERERVCVCIETDNSDGSFV